MADVAAVAGVSHQTVSRVLNGHPSVREATRARVLAAVDELGYRANQAARALARGRGDFIGIVAPASGQYGPVAMRTAIEEAAPRLGFGVSVASVRTLDHASLTAAVGRLLAQQVAGIVVIAPVSSALAVIDDIPAGLPLVVVDGDRHRPDPSVGVDQVRGATLATEHLLDAGHASVWHVSGATDTFDARDRVDGWRSALLARGIEPPPAITGDWSARSGFEAGLALARDPGVTAVFCANDQMALGLMRALHEQGRQVPRDVSVVGFDDLPEAAYFLPPLTTVRQDFAQVAARAMTSLAEQVAGGIRRPQELVEPELVARRSVAPPG